MAIRRKNRVTKKKRGGVHPPTSNQVIADYIKKKRATAKANWLTRPSPLPPLHSPSPSPLPPIDDDVDTASHYNDMSESDNSSQSSIKSKSNPVLPPPPPPIGNNVDSASHYNDMTESVNSYQPSMKSKTSSKLSSKISLDQGKSYLDKLIELSGVDRGDFITHLKGLNIKNISSIHAFFKGHFEVLPSSPKFDTMVDLLEDPRINDLVCEAASMQK
jgi:hypothetical protein